VKINWFKPLTVFLIFAHLLSCFSLQKLQPPTDKKIIEDKPAKIEVYLKNGEKFIINKPFIKKDSLYGEIEIQSSLNVIKKDSVIALGDIEEIKTYQFSLILTTLFVTTVVVGLLIVGALKAGDSLLEGIGSIDDE
jgi:hypothetical protein